MSSQRETLPIIYHPGYAFGWSMHGYDRRKSTHVKRLLEAKGLVREHQLVRPDAVTDEQLLTAHTPDYLDSIKDKNTLARIFYMEVMKRWYLPYFVSKAAFVSPFKLHVGGSIEAGKQAANHGWAINLGGGAHHASWQKGEGFCLFADITISISELRKNRPDINKIMIVDLDAHQGNGHERDFFFDRNVYTIDFYTYEGEDFYPNDELAAKKANINVQLEPYTHENKYLGLLHNAFERASNEFKPDMIYYVAGTDVLAEDVIGKQAMTPEGLVARDEIVFDYALGNNTPIVMLLAGGYQKNNAQVIADSIENLNNKYGLLNIVNKRPSLNSI